MYSNAKIHIERIIALPLVLKVFIQDKEKFKDLYAENLYLDMIDDIIERIPQDISDLRVNLLYEYGIRLYKVDGLNYTWKSNTGSGKITYTSIQLKNMTSVVMSEYLYGKKSKQFKRKERIWDNNFIPPDINID